MYAQNKEDEIIAGYFGNEIGTLLSIGENDGITFSNSRLLILKGWQGHLVEPDPQAYHKLRELYAGNQYISTYNVAIGEHDTRMAFYSSGTHLKKGDTGLLSTLVAKEKDRWKSETFTDTRVEVQKFQTFMEEAYARHDRYPVFDFISIDAEGMDVEILKQIDLTHTKLICIEWNSIEKVKQEILSYCTGFNLIHQNAENLILAR